MSKNRLNADEAFKSIMGSEFEEKFEEKAGEKSPVGKKKTGEPAARDKLIQTSFYITEKHRRALKIRSAISKSSEDKDQSAIVRAALDSYLTEMFEWLE